MSSVGYVGGEPVGIDLDAEVALQKALLALAKLRLLTSAHDVSDGGFGVCVAEACIGNGFGARVVLPGIPDVSPVARLFSEEPTRVVVSFPKAAEVAVAMLCTEHGVPFEVIGEVGGNELVIDGALALPVGELATMHYGALGSIVGD